MKVHNAYKRGSDCVIGCMNWAADNLKTDATNYRSLYWNQFIFLSFRTVERALLCLYTRGSFVPRQPYMDDKRKKVLRSLS